MPLRRIAILGVPVDCGNWTTVLAAIEQDLATAGPPRAVIAVNPEKIIKARQDPRLLQCLRDAALLIPDGVGVVLAARLLGLGRMERVPGSELMPKLCAMAARRGQSVYLFGGKPDVNDEVTARLPKLYPGLRIAGRHHGYVHETGMGPIVADINASGAELLFLALGSPRQELWMAAHLPELNVRICQGVGGTFDVIADRVRRAPRAFIALNLEWLYRLLSQPQRLLRQTALPQFAWLVLKTLSSRRGRT
jgi:N-acetylglucosaminyldiphosphoundecaprenol N-acetyl-beta-D-mannosaminyltransferase